MYRFFWALINKPLPSTLEGLSRKSEKSRGAVVGGDSGREPTHLHPPIRSPEITFILPVPPPNPPPPVLQLFSSLCAAWHWAAEFVYL